MSDTNRAQEPRSGSRAVSDTSVLGMGRKANVRPDAAPRRAAHRHRHGRDGPGRLLPRPQAARRRLDGARRRARRRTRPRRLFGGHERLRRGAAGHPRPRPALRARRRRAARGALQPRRREQRRRLLRRPARDLGVERPHRRPPARRDPPRQPRDALLPGVVGRDVRLASPARASSTTRPRALNPQSPYAAAKAAAHLLCRSYRESYGDPDRLRDPLQPRVAPPRAAVPLAQGGRPRARAPRRDARPARSRSAT